MRTAQAVVAAAMEMAATMMTMAAAVPSSVASATPAERHARQQGGQNKNGNSNGWFGHGTLRARHLRVAFGTTMTPRGT
jgi:Spy/CpxP family protein refolding chaperone